MKKTCKIISMCIIFSIALITLVNAADFNMSYIYGGTTITQINNVKQANGCLDEVSPSYFDLNTDGSLKLTSAIDTTFISQMHEMNIKVVPFLSNHWDKAVGRVALSNIDVLADEIVNAIKKYDLDGINVDIENVTEVDRDNYTLLVKKLREKLGKNKVVAVAVAANPKGWTTGWHGSYDYKELAKYSDYLMLMTYDEHYQGGTSGAVASYEFVENSIKYALKYVEKDKIVLGVAFFGRYWNDENVGGRGVSLRLIEQILSDYNSAGVYDEKTKSMKAVINVSEQQAQNDKYIFEAGTYTFWYENAQTIKEKIELVNKYELKGTGSWSLGQETSNIWENYELWLNNGEIGNSEYKEENEKIEEKKEREFKDVESNRWSIDCIEFVAKNNLMIGKQNVSTFAPTDNLTRAEAVTIINRFIQKANLDIKIDKDINVEFTDIYEHWAKEDITKAVQMGVILGYENNMFKPNQAITREEIITILMRLNILKEVVEEDKKFNDVNKNMWSYKSIMTFSKYGYIEGYEDNTFKPKNNIKREEIAKIIYNICNKTDLI